MCTWLTRVCACRQLIQDDKGTVVIAVFGLPGMTNEDDLLRGLKTAIQIHRALAKVGEL